MTNPFKRPALSDELYSGAKRRALTASLAKGKAVALSQENRSAPYNKKSHFLCRMCFDPKPKGESFPISGCSHSYCRDCTTNYIGTKLQQNMLQIRCPVRNCCGLLEPHNCRSILPEEVFARWEREEDIMLMMLAKNKQWRTCPKCDIFVDRIEGCSFMTCRADKTSSSRGYYCSSCKA